MVYTQNRILGVTMNKAISEGSLMQRSIPEILVFINNSFRLIVKINFILVSFAMNATAQETKIYQQDAIGNIQYHKPSYTIQKDGRIVETDKIGNKLYHKQQYKIKDGKIYQIDSLGNIQYHKPQLVIK
jgi:hypothetical protein